MKGEGSERFVDPDGEAVRVGWQNQRRAFINELVISFERSGKPVKILVRAERAKGAVRAVALSFTEPKVAGCLVC